MLNNNTVLKVVSLILAICLWGFVMGEVNPTVKRTFTEIPVQFVNVETIEDQGLTLTDQYGYTVSVEVKGSRSELNAMEKDDIVATADVFGYGEGTHSIKVNVSLPDGVNLENIREGEVQVNIEKLVSVRKDVRVEFTGDVAEGTEPGSVDPLPAEVTVTGAESVVNKVDAVQVKVDAGKLDAEVKNFTATPVAVNKNGNKIKNVKISAHTVEVQAILLHTKTVPLTLEVVGTPDKKLGKVDVTIPGEITIKGSAELLAGIDGITAADIDISEVDGPQTIRIEPELPYGIELADASGSAGVKIEFKK